MKVILILLTLVAANLCYAQVNPDSLKSGIIDEIGLKNSTLKAYKLDVEGNYAFLKYPNGNFWFKYRIIKKGKKYKFHGEFFRYYENGIIQEEGAYYKDKKFGLWLFYDEKGQLKKKEYFL